MALIAGRSSGISFDEYVERQRKKKKDEEIKEIAGRSSGISFDEYVRQSLGENYSTADYSNVDFAPVKTIEGPLKKAEQKNEKGRKWFEKGLFEDGYQSGDVAKTILGTTRDFIDDLSKGVLGMGEGVIDTGASVVGLAGKAFGNKDLESKMSDFIKKDLIDEDKIVDSGKFGLFPDITAPVKIAQKIVGFDTEEASVLGEKADALVQSGGQLGATIGLQFVGVPWWLTTGVTSYGGQTEKALNEGATFGEAAGSALITAGADILTEKLSGGIKFGGKTLDDVLLKPLTEKIAGKTLKTLANFGIDAVGEGAEEVIASVFDNLGTKLYKDESVKELLANEEAVDEYIESFIGGAVLGGGVSGITSLVNAKKSAFTENERKVIMQEVKNRIAEKEAGGTKLDKKSRSAIEKQVKKDLEKGYISIDTIESTLGGETLGRYNSVIEQENKLQKEIETLENMKSSDITVKQSERLPQARQELEELRTKDEKTLLKGQLSSEVQELVKKDRLSESYHERARRSKAFEADLTKYDAKQREVVKRAVESGIMNNTNRTHEFVDMIAKIAADKGVSFDFTNNAKLKETGFSIDGKTINGYVKDGNVTVNIQSNKALDTVVGHEITHVLEGTDLYAGLQSAVKEYATTKGEYQARYDELVKLYKDVDGAVIENEITADFVGEYLFTDDAFINKLSVEKPNIFKRIYEEIKYLAKIAIGNKEAVQLEKVKRAFEKAYKEASNAKTGTVYSLEKTSDGIEYVKVEKDLFLKDDHTLLSEKEIFDSLAGKTLSLPDGEIKIVKRLPEKNMYKELFQRYPRRKGVEDVKKLNSDVNRNMEDLILNSNLKKANEPDVHNRHAKQGISGFDTRVVKFYDGVNAYNIDFSIAILENGEKIAYAKKFFGYDDVLTKKIQDPEARGKSPLNRNPDNVSISQNQKNASTKYSISEDTSGRSLTKEQQEYFKDSKIVDESGNLKVMYHGSPAQFTVFDKKKARSSGYYGKGFYFTDSESHAGQYGQRYEVYLDIKNPVRPDTRDITKEQLRKFVDELAENEDYGIENYGYYATVDGVTENVYGKDDFGMLLDLNATCVGDMVEAIELFNEVNGTDYDGIIAPTETVAFYPEQIKKIDNKAPTNNADIRYSLSADGKMVDSNGNEVTLETSEVGEHGTLMAIRNINEGELRGMLEIGGIPAPSIAITNPAKVAHSGFGEISVLFDKETIDPVNKKNEVYDRDVWTSRFPRIEYEADTERSNEIRDYVYALQGKAPDSVYRALYPYAADLENELNRNGGVAGLVEALNNNYNMKQAYLYTKGKFVDDVFKITETKLPDIKIEEYDTFISELGKDVIESLKTPQGENPVKHRREWFAEHEADVKAAYRKYLQNTNPDFAEEDVQNVMDSLKPNFYIKELRAAMLYIRNGATTVKEEFDLEATRNEVNKRVNMQEYRQWLKDFFKGVEKNKGIANGKDPFTASGNRRSFSQTHDKYTLANLVKNMTKGRTQGSENAMFGVSAGAISANMAKKYTSIAEIKNDEAKIRANADEMTKPLKERLGESIGELRKYYKGDSSNAYDSSTAAVFEFSTKKLTEKNLRKVLKEYYFDAERIPVEALRGVIADLNALKNIPTDYFEAKPQRAVGLDEVQGIVIPNTTDIELKKELMQSGFYVIEYDPNIENDRQTKINQFDNLKFSLGEQQAKTGRFYGKDIELEAPMQAAAEENAITDHSTVYDDYAPLTEAEAKERDEIQGSRVEAPEDIPEAVEVPYYGEGKYVEPDSPFDEMDIQEVGDRSKKAYMYENPQVKPFFQEEAQVMLAELRNSIKGEKFFNDQLYYDTNGESGWFGTKRETSEQIAYLLDRFKYTYKDIEKGLNAIIEDNGKENNAISKRIEFMIDERLREGYTDFTSGYEMPPNQEYIDFLTEKNITDYSDEAWNILIRSLAEAEHFREPAKTPDGIQQGSESFADDIAPTKDIQPEQVDPDGETGKKQRKWVKTSTESEVVNREILPDDLDKMKIRYTPVSNKQTLNGANARLDILGYEKAVAYFDGKIADRKTSLEDIALGERLIQEAMKKGDTKTAGELIQNVAILGTELGQKVQALSIIQRMTPEGQLKMIQKTVNRGKAKGDPAFSGVEVTQDMTDRILGTYNKYGSYNQTELDAAVEDVKQKIADQMNVTGMEKVNAWRYLAMLGNPKTHIRNLVSNAAMYATTEAKNVLARTVETIAPIKDRTKTWKNASKTVKKFAKQQTEEAKAVLTSENSYSDTASIKAKREIFKNKILQKVYDFNGDLLTKEDWWFKKPVYRRSLQEYLTANGIRTQADLQNNAEIVEKAKKYAVEQAQIATFQQYSWLSNKINEIERRSTATQFAVGAVLPFKKTPINIAKTGLAYSPLGFVKSLTYDLNSMKQGKLEASQVVDNLAKGATGSALTYIGYMLAMSGLLNGGGEDDKEGKYDYQLGKQAYSINFDGSTYSLNWLSPVAMPLFVGANAYEMLEKDEELSFDTTSKALAQTLDPMSEMSFLSSLDSILSSYDQGVEKFAGIGEAMLQNYATQFVPTLSSQVATVLDDKKRSTKASANSGFKIGEETLNQLIYKIPFLRETLEPTMDIWGNEIRQTEDMFERAVETFIAPYSRKENISTEIDEELKSLYAQTGDNGLLPKIPDNYIQYKGEKYEMSAKEHTNVKKAYGQTASDLLEDLFRITTYQNANSTDKADMVNDVYEYAFDEAKRDYFAQKGVSYTNSTKENVPYYKENNIKGAIEHDMTVEEFDDFVNNPKKYAVANIVGGYTAYDSYKKALDTFEADINENGNPISGSAKQKKMDYIFSLGLDYGQQVILYRSLFDSQKDKDEYNMDIVDYLNEREDISYEEMVYILESLDFTVDEDGTIRW